MKYAFISGIPASGKSYLAKKAAKKYGYKTFRDSDKAGKELIKLLKNK